MRVELRQLRAVEAVDRLKHFSRAAEELHVAQSALSHQVRQFERELGTPLFERTSRRVRPTEAGSVMARHARHLLAGLESAIAEIDQLRGLQRGTVRIGALHPAGGLDVPRLLARFRKLHPAIEVGLLEGTAAEMFDRLTSGDLDAAFCLRNGDPPSHLTIRQLGLDEIVAVFSTDQAPPTRTVALSDLASLHLIGIRRGSALTSVLEQRLDAVGLRLRLALESGDPFLLRSLAARGFAVAILPRSITSLEGPPVEVRSLRPRIELPVVLAWRTSDDRSPAARAFVDFVLEGNALTDEPAPTAAHRGR